MKLHEYQAKEVLRLHGVPVPPGHAAHTPDEAAKAAQALGGDFWVVKVQVHAGGRGKGRFKERVSAAAIEAVLRGDAEVEGKGGVRLCRSVDAVRAAAEDMLGQTLVTKQTGADGVKVQTVLVTTGADIKRELYAAVLLDRSKSEIVVMASAEGGTEIEEVAAHNPDAIHKVWVHPATGLGDWQARQIGFALGLSGKALKSTVSLLKGIYRAYLETDASLVEINPLIITPEDDAVALDAKMTIDDNGLFRQPTLAAMADPNELDPSEVEAARHGLSFIKLDGNIGCLVNGAGLAMATMDIIKFYGGDPANFLDVGGGANAAQVTAAFKIITRDPNVGAILVNIFGGIMKCDVIAEGVLAAVREVGLKVPLVVRLAGTNVELGKKILAESGLDVIPADTMADAASAVVAAANNAAAAR